MAKLRNDYLYTHTQRSGWMDGWTEGWIDGWMDRRMDGQKGGWTHRETELVVSLLSGYHILLNDS